MPSAGISSAFCTCATSGPWLPSSSGSPPSRISIARWDGVSAATVVLELAGHRAKAIGVPGPAIVAAATTAETPLRRF